MMISEKLPLKTYLYFLAQSINLTAAVMSVTMVAVIGAQLAPSPQWSTLPYGMQFLSLMIATYPASKFMSLYGRRAGFHMGNLSLALSGVTGFHALQTGSFNWLLISHAALGSYIAFANFNRFAATDGVGDALKAKAISLVVAGGVVAAFIGPLVATSLRSAGGFSDFALCYGFFVPLAIVSAAVNQMTPVAEIKHVGDRATPELLRTRSSRDLAPPIVIAAMGYGLMNLLMIQASLQMAAMHTHFQTIGTVIQWHVFAMFAPSFVTGYLISRMGINILIVLGLGLLSLSALINLLHLSESSIWIALVVLGLGWNFTYVAGGALLAQRLGDHKDAMKIQGINDLVIAVLATAGAFLPGMLLVWLGWSGTNAGVAILALGLIGYFLVSIRRNARFAEVDQ
ncbi:MFS transporter [Pseudomonas sp. UBA4194]|uniref:MFS transporter n=1 Tax=Pseudomonas sp. UBA4194 TaxID=1947317 RepID=UPI0025D97FC9|nr:MFS transporter [Pseudomonas sp. UBA4194]